MKPYCLTDLLNGLTTAVIWIAEDEKIGYMNTAAGELFQTSTTRIVGTHWRVILPELVDNLHRADQQNITIHEYTLMTSRFNRVRVSCTVSSYELDSEAGWLVEVFNTERHHRIVEEDERWNQYEAGNLLVSTLAHEVKNPLAGILGATQLLKKRLEPAAKDQAFLDIISKEVLRLTNLVDRMLGPKQSTNRSRHNIHELIRYVLKIIEGEKANNISLKLDYDPSIPDLCMDFEVMVQALLNVVKNALQAMEKNGGVLELKTRVERKFTLGSITLPLVAVISVTDQGEGIPEEIADSIFYPMISSKRAGTGLGLSVSQNILRQHGGLIVASSEPGHTVFNIYLPLNLQERTC